MYIVIINIDALTWPSYVNKLNAGRSHRRVLCWGVTVAFNVQFWALTCIGYNDNENDNICISSNKYNNCNNNDNNDSNSNCNNNEKKKW